MSVELYDYLDTVAPDTTHILSLDPQEVINTNVKKNQRILLGDDNSEEILSYSSDPIPYITIRYNMLDEDEAGTIMDLWIDKVDGFLHSFTFEHPDGHSYTVRFDTDLSHNQYPTWYGIETIRLKVLGKQVD